MRANYDVPSLQGATVVVAGNLPQVIRLLVILQVEDDRIWERM